MARNRKVKGFMIIPSTLASDETGDVDDWTFYKGENLEEAIKGHYQKAIWFECLECGELHQEEEDAEDCC